MIGASVYAAAISGFVGGFVGAFIATGSLSAALTAGLIGAVVSAAFVGAGSFAQWAAHGSKVWLYADEVLAHATVGCGAAMLSGGNCGKGALSAAFAVAAGPLEKSAAEWGGSGAGTVAAGIVGGVAARAVNGSFSEGFSVAAAGYLFADAAEHDNGPTLSQNGNGLPVAFVGGAADYTLHSGAYQAYIAYTQTNPDAPAAYFQCDQGDALGAWIDANHGNVVVYAHSWGAAMAAGVVAAGHDVLTLVTVDPVSWMRPNFQMVADHARTWIDYNATGGDGFSLSNVIAGIGGAWNAAPAPYATSYHEVNASHGAAMCIAAPAGCAR